jgi:7-carboxy-7-deazaguanine synthase
VFGKNPVRHQDLTEAYTLWIQAIFPTLQGEGPFAGHPAVFVRLAGCNLRCWFCDTDFESSPWRPSLEEIVDEVTRLMPPAADLVVLTGGEPFRQNIRPLVDALLSRGWRVQIETNGTLWVDLPDAPDLYIVCSPKTPHLNRTLRSRISAFKYVVQAGASAADDGLPETCTQRPERQARLARPHPGVPVYVMPMDEQNANRNAVNTRECVNIAMNHGYRMTVQLHKILDIE